MRALRLRTQPQFQAVLACAPVARTEHFVMHRLDLQKVSGTALSPVAPAQPFTQEGPWLGAMVPKRWARRAVTRNLIKRQIYQLGQHRLATDDAAYLVRLRATYDRQVYRSAASEALRLAVRTELEQLFSKWPPASRVSA